MPRSNQPSTPTARRSLTPPGRRTRSARKQQKSDALKPDIHIEKVTPTATPTSIIPKIIPNGPDTGVDITTTNTDVPADADADANVPTTATATIDKLDTINSSTIKTPSKPKSARKKAPLPPPPSTPLPPLAPNASRSTRKRKQEPKKGTNNSNNDNDNDNNNTPSKAANNDTPSKTEAATPSKSQRSAKKKKGQPIGKPTRPTTMIKKGQTPAHPPTRAQTIPVSPPPKPKVQMAVKVHRFRNANYIPKGILRLCSTPYNDNDTQTNTNINTNDCPQLAVSREGGAVELVSVNEKWKCVGIVEGMKNRSVDAMAWVCGQVKEQDEVQPLMTDESEKAREVYFNRQHQLAAQVQEKRKLFGASRDGTIFEIDFKSKRHSGVIGSGGGAVFCLESLCPCCTGTSNSCGQLIAAGCEDGSVRIYKATSSSSSSTDNDDLNKACLELVSTLPSVGGAVISIAWLPGSGKSGMEGSIMYAGAADGTIRKFQCTSVLQMARQSGSAAHAISTGAVLNNDDVEMAGDSQLSSLQWKAGLRMTVENRGRRSATKIWALSVLKDGTVVSGDSMGNVQFWDGNAGTLMQTFEHNSNNGDVLDLALSHDQNKLMASGVDSRVICIERVSSTSCAESKWVLTNQQRSHTHDVNSLAMVYQSDSSGSLGPQQKCRELLCSGGVDTKVSSYFVSNMKKYRAKLAYKYPTKAPIALSKVPRILSIMRPDKVDFFQLAQIKTSVEKTSNMALNEEEAYLGSVGITSNHNLVAFDVSDDGKFLAVSHAAGLLLFALNLVEGVSEEDGASSTVLVPKKLNVPTDADVACSALKFGSDFLICATTNGPINLIRLNTETDDTSAMLEHTFEHNPEKVFACESYPITEVTLSADGRWFAAARTALGKGSLQVFSLSKQQLWWTLPCTEAPQSCIKFLGGGGDIAPALAVACNNGVIYLFDVERKCLSDWSDDLGFPAGPKLPKELSSCLHCPESLAYNTATPNKFVMVSYSAPSIDYCTALFLLASLFHALQIVSRAI